MIPKLLAYFSIFLGVLWLIWPQILRGWLVRKSSWMIFWALFLFIFYPLASLAGQWGIKGWVLSFLAIFVLGGLLKKAIGKTASSVPMVCFQTVGLFNIISGLFVIFLRK